jgi:hypothetical protein
MTERKRLRKAHRAYRKALLAENLLAEPLSFKAWLRYAAVRADILRAVQQRNSGWRDTFLEGPPTPGSLLLTGTA